MLKKFTLADPSLPHQVVFFLPKKSQQVEVSCNCLRERKGGYQSMGVSSDLETARALYNDPNNHKKPFGSEDICKW